MKKFQFSLETMLEYQRQVLEAKQQEYALAQGVVAEQERLLAGLEQEYVEFNDEFCEKKANGMTCVEALTSESCLRAVEMDIKKQAVTLKKLEVAAEVKRQEMILAKQDTSSAEKLREKKLEAYNKAVQKNEEAMIDEMVAATWSANRSSVS